MADCNKCLKSLKQVKLKISCVDCSGNYHAKCVNLSAEDVSYLSEQGEVWRCDSCSKIRRKSMVLETKSDLTVDDVFKLISELREDFRRVERSLGESLNACHEELAETKALVIQQKAEMVEYRKEVEELRSENGVLRKRLSMLESRVDDAEQYSRRNTVEIHGVPISKGENVISLVRALGRALDYPLEENMVDTCHRLRSKDGSGKPPGIVLKMVRRFDAEGLLQKRRVKRNLNTHDLGMTGAPAEAVYVNESLSPARRKLLNAARQIKRDKGYTYLWIRGGRILLRKNEGDRVKVISSMDDLNNL